MLMLVPFWTNSLVRIYGWMILLRSQGVINGLLMQFGVIDKPPQAPCTPLARCWWGWSTPRCPLWCWQDLQSGLQGGLVAGGRHPRTWVPGGLRPFHRHPPVDYARGDGRLCPGFHPPRWVSSSSLTCWGGAKTMLLGNLIKNELLSAKTGPWARPFPSP